MALPFSTNPEALCRKRKFHTSLERSMNENATLATNLGGGGAASGAIGKINHMTSETVLVVAVGGVSVACYLLMNRAEKRRAWGRSSRDSSGTDVGGYGEGGIFGWFAGDHHSATDSSCNPVDSGGSDIGGGGGSDGGGGDGGGGGSD
jgi:hypothetical protein